MPQYILNGGKVTKHHSQYDLFCLDIYFYCIHMYKYIYIHNTHTHILHMYVILTVCVKLQKK